MSSGGYGREFTGRVVLYLYDPSTGKYYPVSGFTTSDGRAILYTMSADSTGADLSQYLRNLDITLSELRDSIISKLDEIGSLVLLDYTTTPLAANGQWVSRVDEDSRTGRIVGSVYADQDGTLYVEQSPDGTNWDIVDSFLVIAREGMGFSVEKVCQYARVRFVNDSTNQNEFRLYVYKRLRAR